MSIEAALLKFLRMNYKNSDGKINLSQGVSAFQANQKQSPVAYNALMAAGASGLSTAEVSSAQVNGTFSGVIEGGGNQASATVQALSQGQNYQNPYALSNGNVNGQFAFFANA